MKNHNEKNICFDQVNVRTEFSSIGSWALKSWPLESAHIIETANKLCRNTFLFDLPWDMEQTHVPVTFENDVDWEYMPGNDPEFIYQMNRHRYFICLGQAYHMTGDEKYADCFVRLLLDWIRNAPLTHEAAASTWRTLEAGIRGNCWTKAMRYFQGSPSITKEVMAAYTDSLKEHGKYLLDSFTPFKITSNWGVIESQGLYMIGKDLGNHDYCKEALRRLKLEAVSQILPDGVQWEQSPMYHNEVLSCYLDILWEMEKAEEAPGEEMGDAAGEIKDAAEIADTVEKMAMADLAWQKPDYTQPQSGDSDDTDMRDIMTHASYLLYKAGREKNAGLIKSGAFEQMDYEGGWEFGMKGVAEYARIGTERSEQHLYSLEESGHDILRSGCGPLSDYLHFSNGPLGGGHGHEDRLHLDLCWNGENVLTDAGRYNYVFGEDRVWFKSAGAHNTILADDESSIEFLDSWGTGAVLEGIRINPKERNGYTLLEGGHMGYFQRGKNIYMNRKILVLEEGLIFLIDTALSSEEHAYQRYFHFGEDGRAEREDTVFRYTGRKSAGRIWFDGKSCVKKIESRLSKHYNEYKSNECLRAETSGKGMTVMGAVFSKGEETLQVLECRVEAPIPQKQLNIEQAEGWRIQKGTRSYNVIMRKQDIGGDVVLLKSGPCMGNGRLLVCGPDGRTVSF